MQLCPQAPINPLEVVVRQRAHKKEKPNLFGDNLFGDRRSNPQRQLRWLLRLSSFFRWPPDLRSRTACLRLASTYCADSEAWNETTRHCSACLTYTFVNLQSSEISLPFIDRVRCNRPLTTAVSP